MGLQTGQVQASNIQNATPEQITAIKTALDLENVSDKSLNDRAKIVVVDTATHTASINDILHTVVTTTITDPTPVEGKGYVVKVINGTTTIGSDTYTEGNIVTRFYHSGSWRSKLYKNGIPTLQEVTEQGATTNEELTFIGQIFFNNVPQFNDEALFTDRVIFLGQLSNNTYNYDLPNNNGTLALISDIPSQAHLVDLDFSGAFKVDVRTFASYRLNLTGNATISATLGSNLPNDTSRVVNLFVSSDTNTETLGIDASWLRPDTQSYDPADDQTVITIHMAKDGSGNLTHHVFLTPVV